MHDDPAQGGAEGWAGTLEDLLSDRIQIDADITSLR